jgi:hypothetical protein
VRPFKRHTGIGYGRSRRRDPANLGKSGRKSRSKERALPAFCEHVISYIDAGLCGVTQESSATSR